MVLLSVLLACKDDPADTGPGTTESKPKAVDVVLGPEDAREGDILTCSWTLEGTDGATVLWKVNGIPIDVTAETLDSSRWDKDDWVRCLVTPDGGNEVESNLVQIQNSAPEPVDVVILPELATVDDTVVYVEFETSDPDAADEHVGFEPHYSWTVNGEEAGIDEYALGRAYWQKGDVIGVTVQTRQWEEWSGEVSADELTIGNAPPSAPEAGWDDVQEGGEPLTCRVTEAAEDPDGDGFSYSFSWREFGVAKAFTDTDSDPDTFTLAGDDVLAGGSYTCEVVATDDDGATGEAAIITVEVGGAVIRYLWSTESAAARAGSMLLALDDQDGDGSGELLVGAPQASDQSTQGGAAYVLSSMAFGDDSVVDAEAVTFEIQGKYTTENVGSSLAALDLDGDLYVDLGVGGPGWRAKAGENAGAVYFWRSDGVQLESDDALSVNEATMTFSGTEEDERVGQAVAGLDNCYLNGESQACVVVAAPGLVDQGDVKGGLRVFPEEVMATYEEYIGATQEDGVITILSNGDGVGSQLLPVPDFDGDGFDDLAVASTATGSIRFIDADAFYSPPADTASPAPSFYDIDALTYATLSGADTDELSSMVVFEQSDGSHALLVGGPGNGSDDGAVWLWEMSSGDHLLSDQLSMTGMDAMRLGTSVAYVGERRGAEWIAMGAPSSDVTYDDAGAVYAVRLDEWTASSSIDTYGGELVALYGEEDYDAFGTALAGPLDLDGDGRQDLVVGAPRLDASGVGFDVGGVVVWRTW